jgi:hypothetical protein
VQVAEFSVAPFQIPTNRHFNLQQPMGLHHERDRR